MKRVRLAFAGREVEFVYSERALKKGSDWAERSAWDVHVIYGSKSHVKPGRRRS